MIICDNQFGGYGHPDHIKLHQATVAAFDAAADPARYPEAGPPHRAERLYHPAFSAGWLKPLVRLMPLVGRDPRRFGRNHDIDLVQMLSWESPAHVRIDVRAVSRHQAGGVGLPPEPGRADGILRRVPRWLMRRLLGSEGFTQGWPAPASHTIGRGLFPDDA